MKLHLSLLKKFVDIPLTSVSEIVALLDDLGLEVKAVNNLPNSDVVFTLELLANRADHHGIIGIAREIASRSLTSVRLPALASIEGVRSISLPLRVLTKLCLKYSALELEVSEALKLRPEIDSYLFATPKHAIVDTLNYVQYELGQPLHGFDRDKLVGELRVEELATEQTIEALDGVKYIIPAGAVVIADAKKVVAAAGVIGSLDSCVTKNTKRVVIESACFDPISVRKTARSMGLSTDAAKIFERGSDPESVLTALRRTTYLLSGAGGAVREGGCQVIGLNNVSNVSDSERLISVRMQSIKEAINSPRLPELELEMRLKSLGFVIKGDLKASHFKVVVPSWRKWDVHHEQDILEEFVRSYGLDRIKLKEFPLTAIVPEVDLLAQTKKRIAPVLTNNGFFEVITKSFYSETKVISLDGRHDGTDRHLRLQNALEKANSAMRISLLPSLLEVIADNQSQSVETIKIYEFGRTFERVVEHEIPKAQEKEFLGLAWVGNWHTQLKNENLDETESVFLFKGVIESICTELGIAPDVVASTSKLFHPKIQGQVKIGRKELGIFGLVHPDVVKKFKVRGPVFYGELNTPLLKDSIAQAKYDAPPRFPAARRDLTVFVPNNSFATVVLNKFIKIKSDYCEDISLYDWFRKEGEDFTRLTFRFTFRGQEETLAGELIDSEMERVRQVASEQFQLQMG
jgi:phenylalanyl-tRNA synthetase beta chain